MNGGAEFYKNSGTKFLKNFDVEFFKKIRALSRIGRAA